MAAEVEMAVEGPRDGEAGRSSKPGRGGTARYSATPTAPPIWVTPRVAAYVVSTVAIALFAIVVAALLTLNSGTGGPPAADPNAASIVALATSGIGALTSLSAAYFGIKVATEQSAQSAATATQAIQALAGNSTQNGNPEESDF